MRKINNHGWGTREMIMLSGGLLFALLVVVILISRLYGSYENAIGNREYFNLESNLELAAKNYVDQYNINTDNVVTISSQTLKNYGYISNFIDNKGNECDGYVKVTKIDLVNSYKAFITCGNYKTNDY